jgi:hypothetical protein
VLVRPFGANPLEAAFARAVEIGTLSYGSARSILCNKLDRRFPQRPPANGVSFIPITADFATPLDPMFAE